MVNFRKPVCVNTMDGSSREALQYHRLRDASVYLAFFAVAIIVLVTQN